MKWAVSRTHRGLISAVGSFALAASLAVIGLPASQALAADDVPRGGVLVANPAQQGTWTRNFNPFSPTALPNTLGVLYEPLLYFNRVTGEIHPWLATDYAWSDDALSLTLHLRDDVSWHDGVPFTADDVAFTFNLTKANPALDTAAVWDYLERVEAADKYTVVFHFQRAYTPALWYIAGNSMIVPEHIWTDIDDPVTYTNPNPVGTGGFKLGEFTQQNYRFVRNDNYYEEGRPYIDAVEFPAYADNNASNLAILDGDIDWGGSFIPNIDKVYVANDPEHFHYWFPPDAPVQLYPNLTVPGLEDVAVRRAIMYGMNRNAIVNIAEYGYANVASATGLMLPSQAAYLDEDLAEQYAYEYNVEKAISILEGAGYERGDDGVFVSPSGDRLSYEVLVISGWTDWVTTVRLISDQLHRIGIEVTPRAVQYGAFVSAVQSGKFELAIGWTSVGPSPYIFYYNTLHSSTTAPIGETASTNWERFRDPEVDAILAELAKAVNLDRQQELVDALQEVYATQLPTMPLFYGPTWYEYNTREFEGWPTAENPYAPPAPWQYPFTGQVLLNVHKAE